MGRNIGATEAKRTIVLRPQTHVHDSCNPEDFVAILFSVYWIPRLNQRMTNDDFVDRHYLAAEVPPGIEIIPSVWNNFLYLAILIL